MTWQVCVSQKMTIWSKYKTKHHLSKDLSWERIPLVSAFLNAESHSFYILNWSVASPKYTEVCEESISTGKKSSSLRS